MYDRVNIFTTSDAIPPPRLLQLGYLVFNSLISTANQKTYIFLLFPQTGTWFNFRQVYLDASSDRSKPYNLPNQVNMSYFVADGNLTFEWTV